MSMIAFSVFYDLLMPELPGATTAMVDLHLLHTARDYCERTCAWRFSWARGSIADRANYDISAPEPKSELVRLTRLSVADVLLWDRDWREHEYPQNEAVPKYKPNEPPFTMNLENTEFTLIEDEIPTATTAGAIELTAALKPAFSATQLPAVLKTEHTEAMRTGTLARLMRMGNKPWTDRPLSGEYQDEYTRLVIHAAGNAQRGNTRGPLRTRKTGI